MEFKVLDYGSEVNPTGLAPAKSHLGAIDYGLRMFAHDLAGNQLCSGKNLWKRREYGLRGLWIRRESTGP